MHKQRIALAGGSGYIGSRLIRILLERNTMVRTLVRSGSEHKIPVGAEILTGDVFSRQDYGKLIDGCDTLVHLIGVSHPSPTKAEEFRTIDRASVITMCEAVRESSVRHIIYLSVAHPAPIMAEYWNVRQECEQMIRHCDIPVTFIRPWYVLGPGHRWAAMLKPLYWLWKSIPSTRETALRLDLVTIDAMIGCLLHALESPAASVRIIEPQEIQRYSQK